MILIALGANLPSRYGPPATTLALARRQMQDWGITIRQSSRIWLTAPVPESSQPWYRNAVIAADTALKAHALMEALKRIERDFGRTEAVRDAPRILDLDLLAFGDAIFEKEGLHIPHPRLHRRGFVLYPLREAAPAWRHPVLGKTAAEMIADLPEEERLSDAQAEAA